MAQTFDLGTFVVEDPDSYDKLNEKEIADKAQQNVCLFFKKLYTLKKEQSKKEGPDGEILEYTKSQFLVEIPEPTTQLPREKPIPKPKPLTKWEKFRLERGLPAKKKRSRMVFDSITNDWVPRWGPGSKKQIEDQAQWVREDKGDGKNPFTTAREEKKLELEKHKLRQMKNEMRADKEMNPKKNHQDQQNIDNQDIQKRVLKKREQKSLTKSLELAQVATASMGKFDRKVHDIEPDADKAMKQIKLKKQKQEVSMIQSDKKAEKERNLKVLSFLQRQEEVKAPTKADAHINADKMARMALKKEGKKREMVGKKRRK